MNEVVTLHHAVRDQRRLNRAGGEHGFTNRPHDLPVIRVVASEMPRVVDEAEDALIDTGTPMFSRAGNLVRPITDAVPSAGGRMTQVARLRPLGPDALTDVLAQTAKFQRYDERRRAWVNIDPPAKVAATLLSREGKWRLPPIAGIITTPTLRPDGSLLAQAGYDPATRLYLMLDEDLRMPEIAEAPTREQAEAALKLLIEPLAGFPFVGPVDRAVALSSIITSIIRPALPVAPLHGIRASTAGTGKSFLVDVFSTIATGRPCSVMAVGKTEEETEKRLGALLLDGAPVISIDNVNGELGGDMLCQMTERPLVRVRILGKSEVPEIECRATIFATGNNLTLVGDMTRRAVLCTLDAGVEQPELREFDFDPITRILENRGAYVAAAITIVRASRAAGSPPVCGPIGSYGPWSDSVRSALIWLGEADPVDSMKIMRDEDPELVVISELFAAWREVLTLGSAYTTSQIEDAASARFQDGGYEHPEFRDILMRQANSGPAISTKRLGRWLTRIKGRVVHGWRLEMISDEKRGNRYSLVTVDTAAQGSLL
jgi:putative DNA primase/helicase